MFDHNYRLKRLPCGEMSGSQGKRAWAAQGSFRFKQGSALAKVETVGDTGVNVQLTKAELNFLRTTLQELGR
jgi:hypothetical protein